MNLTFVKRTFLLLIAEAGVVIMTFLSFKTLTKALMRHLHYNLQAIV